MAMKGSEASKQARSKRLAGAKRLRRKANQFMGAIFHNLSIPFEVCAEKFLKQPLGNYPLARNP